MGLAFDHLVHFVRDTAAAADQLRQSGFHVVTGGKHESLGTENALVYFGLSYVELLGVYDRAATERASHIPVMRQLLSDLALSEGPGTLAIRTSDMEATVAGLRDRGLAVLGPFQGSRERPDGTVVRWTMALLEPSDGALPPPFVIQWEQEDAERSLELERDGALRPGGLELVYIGLAVDDAEKTAFEWGRWFGLSVGPVVEDDRLRARGHTLKLPGGDLVFLSPTGPGPLQERLDRRGPRPILIALKPGHVIRGAEYGQMLQSPDRAGEESGRQQEQLGAIWRLLE
ncbi:VOC family protein [Paenibacillus puerhi]|uniref:VOC family protein n=1 Tax=Paenibacillus puerhi TaxID=2692622 RepID=UPI00135A8FBA|nr:VOC family protein [Paenibacillus puerhi]